MPTFVVSAVDANEHDLIAVRVLVDGELVADGLDGKAIPIDPGPHVLRFEVSGSTPVEEKVLIREGQKDRVLRARFSPIPPPAPAAPTPRPEPAPPPRRAEAPPKERGGPPAAAIALAGVGVVGLGAFAFLGLSGASEYDRCSRTPAPCTRSDIDSLRVKRTVAWTAGIVGTGALAAAAWIHFHRSASAGVAIQGTPGGALAQVAAAF